MPNEEHSKAGQESRTAEAFSNLANRTMLTFVIPPKDEEVFSLLAGAIVCKPFTEIGAALRANLAGLLSTVSVPYTLAYRSAIDRRWQQVHSAARIRSLKLLAGPNETQEELELRREREALTCAESEIANYPPEGNDDDLWDTLNFLEDLRSDEMAIRAANELILQGAVLCWCAFEVFARDCFIAHLNAKPDRTLVLLADSVAKRRFDLPKISLETLATHNFNLSERMGT